ncbi:MAG: ABC transporter permease [Flavobacteriales bacterium]|nr:multidrug ABC transporter ATP-binding protein [Flavobacteriaceae bacterium]RZP10732.1 MAG: ABC transporter permease [Flavobacteriales bacterium]|tara:strand:- start:6463 stop:7740 length:1278 start_codon:yes stop_codon:yes gene_type:complete
MNSLKVIFDYDTWQEIFSSVRKNKVRTIITVIGVLWGIFIYITLSGSSNGLDNGFDKEFENIAMNSMFIWTQQTSMPYKGFKTGRRPRLKISDAKVLLNNVPDIQYIAPRNARGVFGGSPPATIVRKSKSGNYNIYGDFPEYTKIATKKIFKGGRFINQIDIDLSRKVCVIGERTKKELFVEGEKVIGEYVKLDDVFFQVIGVHKYIQGGGFETDGDVFIPFTTFKNIYNTGERVGWFTIAAYDDSNVVDVEEQIKNTLKRIHNVNPKDERAISGFNLGEIFNKIKGFSKGMTLLSIIVGIATILAGVIGIGNILLISVKERTKELGVRRAIGATPSEVKIQIILESVFLSLVSGIFGIILGGLVLYLIDIATEDIDSFPYTNPTVPISFILAALLIIISLGTLIGLIPAQRAVSIKPIDALREE